ncbi:MAG: hypothetical protein ISN29_01410 [Gammaproteobacteria bacterium AqS3]|nr:hypothetical protein [Gammaproteobacteria bacterium AqS3]
MKSPEMIPPVMCRAEISAKLRRVFVLAAICFLMSVIVTGQADEKTADNSDQNTKLATDSSEQDSQPKFEQLPAEELREYVAQMKKLKRRGYHVEAGKFDMQFITPVVIAYKELEEQRRQAKWSEKNRKKGRPDSPLPPVPYMAGQAFFGWQKYAKDYSKVVTLQAIPELKTTGGSKAASFFLGPLLGAAFMRFEFKASFDRMELRRNGKKIDPLFADRIAQEVSDSLMDDAAHFGSYRYPVSAFAPGAELELTVWQQGKSKPKTAKVKERVRAQIWSDFEFFNSAGR